ncbi:hypothetical protein GW17_00013287 [Ensete ventricosum]|nr:hypothetical protein GW17_00013287 [Ensete ventricosum]RZS18611.1 hypothetical protein BHM03_00050917 [Ensete ventricosum]
MATTQQQVAGGAKRKPVFTKVDRLKPGTTGHTLTAKVLTSKTVLYKGTADPRPIRISECLLGDETGTIVFTARNEQGSSSSLPFPSLPFPSLLPNLWFDSSPKLSSPRSCACIVCFTRCLRAPLNDCVKFWCIYLLSW